MVRSSRIYSARTGTCRCVSVALHQHFLPFSSTRFVSFHPAVLAYLLLSSLALSCLGAEHKHATGECLGKLVARTNELVGYLLFLPRSGRAQVDYVCLRRKLRGWLGVCMCVDTCTLSHACASPAI